jgi:hypothetical protein
MAKGDEDFGRERFDHDDGLDDAGQGFLDVGAKASARFAACPVLAAATMSASRPRTEGASAKASARPLSFAARRAGSAVVSPSSTEAFRPDGEGPFALNYGVEPFAPVRAFPRF